MQRVHNLKQIKTTRKNLRRDLTLAERKLWLRIKDKQTGYKFRRQHSIGPFIVDFYCPELKLIVEVDGDVHAFDKQIRKDKTREQYLKRLNFKIIRYQNNEIIQNIDGVLEDLYRKINSLLYNS
ncbi:MAG: cytosine methyltransferase [Parcubacteria group bacterium CG_4_10_14_0_8_um_filter_35_7]|nr:MAG: cytosine methyltransferase [Parcubacteria group bacterium CG23_combo_of_CG06-09_8_20_14_all_35_9]PIY78655.1 MAG: cytosine methyltransferase [Parcubacteria group bacterium CG_4_10_14_0_8_um_filter_35_7]